jgi:hypothetical protein
MRHSAVIEVPQVDGSLVVLVVFVGLLLLTEPRPRRVVVRLARRFGDWVTTHRQQTEEWDPEEQQMWLLERRRKLCADLSRVEHLLATDEWMSATRQRGNRIAYNRLVDDLRRIPDVFPTIFQSQTFDPWDEPATDPRFTGLLNGGPATQGRTVEVLEIGWGRRRR